MSSVLKSCLLFSVLVFSSLSTFDLHAEVVPVEHVLVELSANGGEVLVEQDIQAKREWLIDEMVRLGVSREIAADRIESLSGGEVHALYEGVRTLPAGAGFVDWLANFLEFAFYFVLALLMLSIAQG